MVCSRSRNVTPSMDRRSITLFTYPITEPYLDLDEPSKGSIFFHIYPYSPNIKVTILKFPSRTCPTKEVHLAGSCVLQFQRFTQNKRDYWHFTFPPNTNLCFLPFGLSEKKPYAFLFSSCIYKSRQSDHIVKGKQVTYLVAQCGE
jgi:hypothetical protein